MQIQLYPQSNTKQYTKILEKSSISKCKQEKIECKLNSYEIPTSPKTAIIKREDYGDYVEFKLTVGKDVAGFLNMEINSLIPEDGFLVTTSSNYQPEIKHLRSILGEKYSGIGTELIKVALQESFNRGKDGNLWLETETGFGSYCSDYRSGENPIPFYYKLGFESPKTSEHYYIKRCIEKEAYRSLPDNAILMLTPEARDDMLDELFNNPTINIRH